MEPKSSVQTGPGFLGGGGELRVPLAPAAATAPLTANRQSVLDPAPDQGLGSGSGGGSERGGADGGVGLGRVRAAAPAVSGSASSGPGPPRARDQRCPGYSPPPDDHPPQLNHVTPPQVRSKCNIRGGRGVSLALGGLNYQVERHVFASMPRPHLRPVAPVVAAHCLAEGVSCTLSSLWATHRQVIVHLNAVGLAGNDPFPCPLVAQRRAS